MIKLQLISYMQNDVRSFCAALLVIFPRNRPMKFTAKLLVYNYNIC